MTKAISLNQKATGQKNIDYLKEKARMNYMLLIGR